MVCKEEKLGKGRVKAAASSSCLGVVISQRGSASQTSVVIQRWFRQHPGRQQPPVAWRASLVPRGAPSRCGRHSLECASSSHSTAYVGWAAPSPPPQTQHQEHPANTKTGDQNRDRYAHHGTTYYYCSTCLFAKMSNRASLSSFSVSSLASSLWASMSLSLWQLSITNTTAEQTHKS